MSHPANDEWCECVLCEEQVLMDELNDDGYCPYCEQSERSRVREEISEGMER